MPEKLKLGFLASHGGSNMQAIIDACKEGRLSAVPAAVISNNRDSMALQRAEKEGIPRYHLSGATHPDPDELDKSMLEALRGQQVDIVILAGYMKKIGPRTLKAFKGRILNIHPALLPKYGGKGMYGKKVHEAVLAGKEKVTGVTVHLVDEEYDTGPILAQAQVPVLEGDTPDSLAERVLKQEHVIFAETIQKIAMGQIKLLATGREGHG